MMKKILITLLCFLSLIILLLFIATKTSSAYAIGRQYIQSSPQVRADVGNVNKTFLLMYEDKVGPTGKGCASLMYFVVGSNQNRWVQIRLAKNGNSSQWAVVELLLGYRGSYAIGCVYG